MKKDKRDITEEFGNAFQFVYGWKINKILIASLNRSIQTVNLMVGREAAVKVVWNYIKGNYTRQDYPIPTKRITKKQKEKLLGKLDQAISRNKFLVEEYRNLMPQDKADAELQSNEYMMYQSFSDNSRVGFDGSGWITLNDWETIGSMYIDGPKDLFLYDYLSNLKDFSN